MEDLELAKAADKAGFKYIWASEHHFLDEYSHLSANDVCWATWPTPPSGSISARASSTRCPRSTTRPRWPRRSRCSTTSPTAGSSSAPAAAPEATRSSASCPGMNDLSGTREIWEDVIGEFPKMWLQDEYQGYQGKFW